MRLFGVILMALGVIIIAAAFWALLGLARYAVQDHSLISPLVDNALGALIRGAPTIGLGAILYVLADRLPKRG